MRDRVLTSIERFKLERYFGFSCYFSYLLINESTADIAFRKIKWRNEH